jgi:drug/metabolite transporter (DMT)-like permease
VAYVFALLAALAFALGSVLQQRGTLETAAAEGDPRFLTQILHRPVWLAGTACQSSGWVLQAAALDRGSLIVVQSLTTLSLVLALPLGARLTHQRIGRRVWLGALAMVVGIVAFLSVGSPSGGTATPSAAEWWAAGASSATIVAVLVLLGRARSGAARALLFGSAAGVCYAMQVSVTKVFVTLVGGGLATYLTSWTIYALIASALLGFVLQQSALKTGVLAPAMASSNAVTLFMSVLLGITVFGETLHGGGGRRLPAVLGLLVALLGVSLLAGAQPPTSQPSGTPSDAAPSRRDAAGRGA